MFEKLYLILGCIEILIIFIFIGKYLFFEKFFCTLRSWYLFFGTFLLGEVIICFFDRTDEMLILSCFVSFGLLVFLSRKKHKIKGVFLILPVSGIFFSIILLPVLLLYLFQNSMDSIFNMTISWMWIFDVLFWVGFIFFVWKRKRWICYNEVIDHRTLSKWERNLINTSCLFLLVLSVLLISVDEFKIASPYAKFFVGFGIFTIIVLDISIILLVVQGNGKTYFQQAAMLNEYFLKAQLEHFKTYQETQRETRRVYHDMKNNISCLYNLILEGENEEAIKYVKRLNEQVQKIDKEIHTGNDIVDAILNEKYANAKKDGITFSINGKLANLTVDAIDLCTIFSNAIDNSVEALKDSSVLEKELQIKFTQQNEMQFLMFRNLIGKYETKSSFFTTKKNPLYHGFGLENIRLAIEKYQGHMEYHIENVGHQKYFVLEIILFMQPTT